MPLSSGKAPLAKAALPGTLYWFSVPATFLNAQPPTTAANYQITVTPYDSTGKPIGGASPGIAVTQVADKSKGPTFTGTAVFPVLELVHYQEQKGQFQVPVGTAQLRVSTGGKAKTDPICLSIKDANGLLAEVAPQKIDVITGSETKLLPPFLLKAVLPPARSQLGQDQQFAEWQKSYQAQLGVDLRAVMDWCGPQTGGSVPMDGHREFDLYRGIGDSTPCQDGKPVAIAPPPDTPVCDAKSCVSLAEMTRILHQRLDCRVVGYSFFVGRSGAQFESFGKAHTSANPPPSDFKPSTKMTIASASKLITALASIKVLQKHKMDLGSKIGPYLPHDWKMPSPIMGDITFRDLLAQTSGIKDYGNHGHDYAAVMAFFTQQINFFDVASITQGVCAKADVKPEHPILPNDRNFCYSNYNTAVLRILLPMIEGPAAGFVDDDPANLDPVIRAKNLADAYVRIVQTQVFEPLGLKNVDCRPPAGASYALAYLFPGSKPGYDWSDQRLSCGAQGWYLSVEDYVKVLLSLNANDGKLLTQDQTSQYSFTNAETQALGWDMTKAGSYRYLEKNGGESVGNGDSVSTSVAIIGGDAHTPGIVGVLFLNSDISSEPRSIASDVLLGAYLKSLKQKH